MPLRRYSLSGTAAVTRVLNRVATAIHRRHACGRCAACAAGERLGDIRFTTSEGRNSSALVIRTSSTSVRRTHTAAKRRGMVSVSWRSRRWAAKRADPERTGPLNMIRHVPLTNPGCGVPRSLDHSGTFRPLSGEDAAMSEVDALRGCLKIGQASQATDHEMDHRHADHGFTGLG
jgi:hypothetical protein